MLHAIFFLPLLLIFFGSKVPIFHEDHHGHSHHEDSNQLFAQVLELNPAINSQGLLLDHEQCSSGVTISSSANYTQI